MVSKRNLTFRYNSRNNLTLNNPKPNEAWTQYNHVTKHDVAVQHSFHSLSGQTASSSHDLHPTLLHAIFRFRIHQLGVKFKYSITHPSQYTADS